MAEAARPEDDPHSHSRSFVDRGVGVPDRLQRLWAPYRMNYIVDAGLRTSGGAGHNPFTRIPTLTDEEGLIVARGEHVYCVLNLYPYNSGHVLVVPYRQVSRLEDLSGDESSELMRFAQNAVKAINKVSSPQGFNVGFNLGRSSGGSVNDHIHLHVVPRWGGDANFMTVIDGTKVLPQLLRDTRALLAEAWRDILAEEGDGHA